LPPETADSHLIACLPAIRGTRNLSGHVFRSGDGERGSRDCGKVRCRRYHRAAASRAYSCPQPTFTEARGSAQLGGLPTLIDTWRATDRHSPDGGCTCCSGARAGLSHKRVYRPGNFRTRYTRQSRAPSVHASALVPSSDSRFEEQNKKLLRTPDSRADGLVKRDGRFRPAFYIPNIGGAA